jgi:uncharacterized protein YjbI with pentapeptide repeats
MKLQWKDYLLNVSLIIVAGSLLFFLVGIKNTGFETKNLWDWMELLLTPLVLAGSVIFLSLSKRADESRTEENRTKIEREMAIDQQQEAALQVYLDRMEDLLLTDKLRTAKSKEVRNVARVRTLAVLLELDAKRKGIVLLFLSEAGLINTENPIIDLDSANLQYAELQGADLKDANLQGVHLEGANLRDTHLEGVNLNGAYLQGAHLRGAYFQGANLRGAHLRGARLNGTELEGTSLERATMPNGRKHE